MTAPIVSLRRVCAGYGERSVLRDVDFSLAAGEVVAVLGANGSGKSTLVKTILRSTTLTCGDVELFGMPAAEFRDWRRIGYVPQRLSTGGGIPATVREVVSSGRVAHRSWFRPAAAEDRRAIDRALSLVDLAAMAGDPIDTLSGGQQRRALIARALAGEPEVLVMDEPTAGVDAASQAQLADTLRALVDIGATILLVAHELGPVEPLVTRVVSMAGGEIACDGPVAAHALHGGHDGHDPHPHAESPRHSGIGLLN